MKPNEYYNYAKPPRKAWWLPLVIVLILTPILSVFRSCEDKPADASDASQQVASTVEAGLWHTALSNGTLYKVLDREYAGDFDVQTLRLTAADAAFDCEAVMTAEEYKAFCTRWGLTQAFPAHAGRFAVVAHTEAQTGGVEVQLGDVTVKDAAVTLLLRGRFSGTAEDSAAYVLTVPVDAAVTALEVEPLYLADEVGNP